MYRGRRKRGNNYNPYSNNNRLSSSREELLREKTILGILTLYFGKITSSCTTRLSFNRSIWRLGWGILTSLTVLMMFYPVSWRSRRRKNRRKLGRNCPVLSSRSSTAVFCSNKGIVITIVIFRVKVKKIKRLCCLWVKGLSRRNRISSRVRLRII